MYLKNTELHTVCHNTLIYCLYFLHLKGDLFYFWPVVILLQLLHYFCLGFGSCRAPFLSFTFAFSLLHGHMTI